MRALEHRTTPLGEEGGLRSTWVHLQHGDQASEAWLQQSGLDELVCEALLADETRPRTSRLGAGLLLILRGVNLNDGAEPEDMISLRLYLQEGQVITVERRPLRALRALVAEIEAGRGPSTPMELVLGLVERLAELTGEVVEEVSEQVDDLEEQVLEGADKALRRQLSELRARAIGLRRHLAPQRDALSRFTTEDLPWLSPRIRAQIREVADHFVRLVEDLDAIRDRAAVVQDELHNRLSDQMNRNTYLLSMVAGIFLPLGLLTGLLGINVGGIPMAQDPWGFAAVVVALVVLGIGEVVLFWRLHWL